MFLKYNISLFWKVMWFWALESILESLMIHIPSSIPLSGYTPATSVYIQISDYQLVPVMWFNSGISTKTRCTDLNKSSWTVVRFHRVRLMTTLTYDPHKCSYSPEAYIDWLVQQFCIISQYSVLWFVFFLLCLFPVVSCSTRSFIVVDYIQHI